MAIETPLHTPCVERRSVERINRAISETKREVARARVTGRRIAALIKRNATVLARGWAS